MIPILYDKTGKIKLGELVDIIDSGYVEEERNGIFEFTIDYPTGYPLSDLIVEENMIETKPNEEQGLQKFRIYDTKRLMKNVISVFARHESFDLANDHVENINLENASCEYALNTLFRNSHFSTHYIGYSDIINAQNYKIDNVNILNAIAGKEGSIIDTYGTGAEILRDGTNIHVLNKRGHDNEVTIEFGKNLTDFVLERDLTNLETRVGGFAKYTPKGVTSDTIECLSFNANKTDYNIDSKGYIFIGGVVIGSVIDKGNPVPIRVYNTDYEFNTRVLNPMQGQYGVPIDAQIDIVSNVANMKVYGVWIDQNSTTKWKSLCLENNEPNVYYEDFEWNENHFILGSFKLGMDKDGKKSISSGSLLKNPKPSPVRPITETNNEVVVYSDWVDSPFIKNFAHPYISVEGRRDYSDKFKDNEIPTKDKLNKLCEAEFKINKRDIPKSNYTIKFIPLSKCVGYEGTQDKISLCDTVRIIDKRFNVDTKAKVIKYKYDFIKERYESMELGEPRTTLGDIIGGGKPQQGPPGKDGSDGKDGSVEDFPDILPNTPVLTAAVKGFSSIDLSWTFDNKVYYTYELYASKNKDFNPNTFDLIHSGQSSSFLFQAKPGEIWYFRVCAKNTHGSRTEFSPQVTVSTKKVDDFDEYFSSLAVSNLVANMFSADYMEAGIIKGNWIDARQFSVTDGNGKRTFDINSFGDVVLQPSAMKVMARDKVEFIANNGRRDMLLYGGQTCIYNNMDGNFLSTIGSVVNAINTFKGTGFLLSKHCSNFVVGRDAEWDDILTNRDPKPTHALNVDFINHRIHMLYGMNTGDIYMGGNNLDGVNVAYIKDLYSHGWKDHNTGQQLISSDGTRMIVHLPISFNGNTLMNPTLYTNRFYFTNGHLAFGQHDSGANIIMNGCHWDFQGFDIVNATLRNCNIVQNVINSTKSARFFSFVSSKSKSTFDEINVVETNILDGNEYAIGSIGELDVSNVTNKDELMADDRNAKTDKLITLLFKEVKSLKEEIKRLKEGV